MKKQKGQSLVEVAGVLGLVAVVVCVIIVAADAVIKAAGSSGTASFIDQITFDAETKALQAEASYKANEHAVGKHVEAAAISACLSAKGPYQVWRDKYDKKKFYSVCNLDTGEWGFMVCTADGHNKTAFSPGDHTRSSVFGYLERTATRYLLGLPSDCK